MIDLEKLAGGKEIELLESYMLVRILDVLIVHTMRYEPCREDSSNCSRFAEFAGKQAIKGTLDEFGSHVFGQKVR